MSAVVRMVTTAWGKRVPSRRCPACSEFVYVGIYKQGKPQAEFTAVKHYLHKCTIAAQTAAAAQTAPLRKCTRCGEYMAPLGKGRPPEFCGNACKQAAWRQRHRKKLHAVHVQTSSKRMDYETPPEFFRKVSAELGPFSLDAAASAANAKCRRFVTQQQDSLRADVKWTGRVWLNPPYGRGLHEWIAKAFTASRSTAELVAVLVPVRGGVGWWSDYVQPVLDGARPGDSVQFIPGRLKFVGMDRGAPFASMLLVFRNPAALSAPKPSPKTKTLPPCKLRAVA